MLPPVGESVLQNNPEFAALYSTLSTAILNPDGTTKDDQTRSGRERDSIRKELDARRVKSAKERLLAHAISTAVPPEPRASAGRSNPQPRPESAPDLPEPLLDLLLLLPPLLTSTEQLSPESTRLLLSSPPFSSLDTLLPDLARLVSSNLQSSAVQLARAAYPTTNASFLHRHIASVPSHVGTLSSAVQQQSAPLVEARLAVANCLIKLLQKHTQALTILVRSLEAKHGGVARSLEFRGAEVCLEAQRGEIDADTALWNVRKDVYSPEVREALKSYASHLRDIQRRLGEAVRTAQAELGDYGVALDNEVGDAAKERTMREIARVYRDMRRQMEEAQRDLRRLR